MIDTKVLLALALLLGLITMAGNNTPAGGIPIPPRSLSAGPQ